MKAMVCDAAGNGSGTIVGYNGRCSNAAKVPVFGPESIAGSTMDFLLSDPIRHETFRRVKSYWNAGTCLAHWPGGTVFYMRGKEQ